MIVQLSFSIEIVLDPEFGIIADVSLVIDATNSNDIEGAIAEFETVYGDQWDVDSKPVYITSTPSASPSTLPSFLPSTLQPSAKPSITGLVVTIDVTC